MSAQIIANVKLDGNADAVEFCPHAPYYHLLAAATYNLLPSTQRIGSITLFTSALSPLHVVKTSGVFDIKWSPFAHGNQPFLSQAGSDGYLTTYRLAHEKDDSPQLEEVAKVMVTPSMCLSLEWDPFGTSVHQKMVSSHSDGSIAVVDFAEGKLEIDCTWKAHGYEVWTVVCDHWKPNVVYSGADDSFFCGWDVRESMYSPIFQDRKSHQMGVCCIQSNPKREHIVVTGSYDEQLRVWDMRTMQKPLLQTNLGLGGGVWKLKWHPFRKDVLLAACMHNGFAIVQIVANELVIAETYMNHESLAYGADWFKGEQSIQSIDEFTYPGNEDKNMGGSPVVPSQIHGANFVSRNMICPDHAETDSMVATCSFYDQSLHVWRPKLII